jgi:hypothetical protein
LRRIRRVPEYTDKDKLDLQKSTTSLLYISAAIAVVLWLLATLLQLSLQPARQMPVNAPQPVPESREVPAEQAAGQVMERRSSHEVCSAIEDELRSVIGEARQCTTDDECTLFDYGYPIDCMTSVAKSGIVTLREAYREYDESCEHRVFYDCPTEPFVRLPVCQSGRCEVELVDPRSLQVETVEEPERN